MPEPGHMAFFKGLPAALDTCLLTLYFLKGSKGFWEIDRVVSAQTTQGHPLEG